MSQSLHSILKRIPYHQKPPCSNRPISHVMKCWPKYFEDMRDGYKTFDARLRKEGREFSEGQYILLREWDQTTEKYTGRLDVYFINHLITAEELHELGFKDDFDILSTNRVIGV